MPLHYRRCQSDEDYAKYTLHFIRNRTEFTSHFSVADTLIHILQAIKEAHIIMIEDEARKMVGWGHYHYMTDDGEADPAGKIVLMDSIILAKEYRSSRQFFSGFGYVVKLIAEENPDVETFQFYALEDNAYLNRLYAKFARVIGKREGYHGTENIYSTAFAQLRQYLKV